MTFDANGRKLRANERKEAFRFCAERDGDSQCKMRPGESLSDGHTCAGRLILHHIDNNPCNNPTDGSNWMILCLGHNHRCNPRGKVSFHNPKYAKRLGEFRLEWMKRERIRSESLRRNIIAEPIATEFIERTMQSNERVQLKDLVNGARQEVRLQTEMRYGKKRRESIGRKAVVEYLEPYCNPFNGIFEMVDDEKGITWIVRKRQ